MTVYSYEMAKEVSELAEAMGCKVYVHIKLDTGMARLGFQITEENAEEIAKISKLPNLVMEGMFTHFPSLMKQIRHLPMSSLINISG